jgi:hypothetical protein
VNFSAEPHALSKNGLHVSLGEPGIGICEVSAARVFISVVERSSNEFLRMNPIERPRLGFAVIGLAAVVGEPSEGNRVECHRERHLAALRANGRRQPKTSHGANAHQAKTLEEGRRRAKEDESHVQRLPVSQPSP